MQTEQEIYVGYPKSSWSVDVNGIEFRSDVKGFVNGRFNYQIVTRVNHGEQPTRTAEVYGPTLELIQDEDGNVLAMITSEVLWSIQQMIGKFLLAELAMSEMHPLPKVKFMDEKPGVGQTYEPEELFKGLILR